MGGLHILIIPSEPYVPKENPLFGIFQRDQAHALQRAGHKVGVLTPQLRPLRLLKNRLYGWEKGVDIESDEGVVIFRFHGWIWTWRIPHGDRRLWVRAGMRLFGLYTAEHGPPDLVHAHNAMYGGVLALRIKEKFNIPYALTEHSSRYARGLISDEEVLCAQTVFRNADKRIVVSPSLGHILENKIGEAACPWEWVPNILDRRFESLPSMSVQPTNLDGTFRFMNVGMMNENKGQMDLLRAFASKFRELRVELRIVGNGPIRAKLEMLAAELEIDRQVVFLGQVDRERILYEMCNCHAYVHASHYETFGVVLIEALACGKPVVSTSCGGPECIVTGENGLLVPPRAPVALGEAMLLLYKKIKKFDSKKIREDCVERFGERNIVAKLSRIYREMLANDRSLMSLENM